MNRKTWVLMLVLLSEALAQRGLTTEVMAQGLKWVLDTCQLQAQVLRSCKDLCVRVRV